MNQSLIQYKLYLFFSGKILFPFTATQMCGIVKISKSDANRNLFSEWGITLQEENQLK